MAYFYGDHWAPWPISMAIIGLQELSLYYYLDASTIIDLYQYIGALEENDDDGGGGDDGGGDDGDIVEEEEEEDDDDI